MTQVDDWIRSKIDECTLGGVRGRAGLEDLLRAVRFFEGQYGQIFGMALARDAVPEAQAHRAALIATIRGWFDELGATDVPAQINLFEVAQRHAIPLDLPEPPLLVAKREREQARTRELEALGRPSEFLPVEVQQSLVRLREAGARRPFAKVRLGLPKDRSVRSFEWLGDTWSAVAGAGLEPAFLPLAGADGDFLGLVLDAALLADGQVPLVHSSHEEDPIYTWVAESCESALAAFSDRSPQKGKATKTHSAVARFLSEMNASFAPDDRSMRAVCQRWARGERTVEDEQVVETQGSPFAKENVRALRVWREHDAR